MRAMNGRISPRPGNSRPVLAAVAGVITWLVLLLFSSGCGGGDGDAVGLSGSQVHAGGVTLTLPAGWAFLDKAEDGLVLASREEDLPAEAPQGPRLTVGPAGMALPDPEELVDVLFPSGTEDEGEGTIEVIEEPDTVAVGSEEGVSVGLREEDDGGPVIRRYVIVNVDGINVHQFVLEAPEDQWDSNVDTLEAIMGSAAFEAPAVAAEVPTTTAEAPAGVPSDWRLILRDTFDSNVNDWPTGEAAGGGLTEGSLDLAGGAYPVSFVTEGGMVFPATAESIEVGSDFHVAVDAFRREGGSRVHCGLSLRGESGYPRLDFLVLDLEGQFRVLGGDRRGGGLESVVESTPSPAIRSEGVNRVAVRAQGSHLILYINGERVGEADDDRVGSVRSVGVAAGTSFGAGAGTCEFDNFEVRGP